MRVRKPSRRAGVMAVILAALAGTAGSQDRTDDCSAVEAMPGAVTTHPYSYGPASDSIVLAQEGQSFRLCYHNHERHVSNTETHTLIINGFSVVVSIVVSGGENSGERMTITPPEGWMVFPADYADASVSDGSALTVLLFSGLM